MAAAARRSARAGALSQPPALPGEEVRRRRLFTTRAAAGSAPAAPPPAGPLLPRPVRMGADSPDRRQLFLFVGLSKASWCAREPETKREMYHVIHGFCGLSAKAYPFTAICLQHAKEEFAGGPSYELRKPFRRCRGELRRPRRRHDDEQSGGCSFREAIPAWLSAPRTNEF
ncbi:hypothetical protein MTO96_003673 [Rhipicephalus appendiculatus]